MEKADYFILGLFIGFIITLILIFIQDTTITKKPSAIDVYRNKTNLEITYKDSIPIDSVVVFK